MTSTTAEVLVIQHEDDCPPGVLGEVLATCTRPVRVVRGYEGETIPQTLDGVAALIVLGGGMGACEDADHAWLAPTRDLIRRARQEELPTLGICLGAQMAAVALDGSMGRAAEPEVGMCAITLTPEGEEDPVLSALPRQATVFQWHQDAITDLPEDAVLLAGGPGGMVQAYRSGPCLWATQFHPEVNAEIVVEWARTSSLRPVDTPPEHYGTSLQADTDAVAQWRALLEAFLAQVR